MLVTVSVSNACHMLAAGTGFGISKAPCGSFALSLWFFSNNWLRTNCCRFTYFTWFESISMAFFTSIASETFFTMWQLAK